MLGPLEPVETARLTLRPLRADDLDDVARYHGHPDVVRYIYPEVRDRDEAREALHRDMARDRIVVEGDALVLAVVPRDVGRVVGQVSLGWLSAEHRQGEIGFLVHPDHQGRGFAREAAEVVLALAFENLGLHRVMGRCDARNAPSAGLMERLGMRREAHFVENEWFKGAWGDEFVYALLEDEWRARRDAARATA